MRGKDLAPGLAPSCEFFRQVGVSGGISENVSKTNTSEESHFKLVTELVMIFISRFSGAYERKIT